MTDRKTCENGQHAGEVFGCDACRADVCEDCVCESAVIGAVCQDCMEFGAPSREQDAD